VFKDLLTLFLCFFCAANISKSQIISAAISANSDEFTFNHLFIKNNLINTVTGIPSTKKEGDKIRQKNEKRVWIFYPEGVLKKEANYFNGKNGGDSLVNQYTYNGNLLPLCKTTFDYSGIASICLEYIEEEMPVKETYSKLEVITDSSSQEKKLISHQISSEEFKYLSHGNQLVKRVFNSYEKEYKQEKKMIDELGYVKEISICYIINNYITTYNFTYNQNGLLETKSIFDNTDKNNKTVYQYKYDDKNNIIVILTFKNNAPISEKQFIYNQKNYFLEAMLTKDIATNFIKIEKYDYKY
jgi:hypothetical protein